MSYVCISTITNFILANPAQQNVQSSATSLSELKTIKFSCWHAACLEVNMNFTGSLEH